MDKLFRNVPPICLTDKIKGEAIFLRKGKAWLTEYSTNKNSKAFAWGSFKKSKRSDQIIAALALISDEHCFYCDAKWVRKGNIEPEIDHFCPKTVKPLKAFYYPNLFLCCGSCNRYKSNRFHRRSLIKLDEVSYNFDDYFFIDFATGKVRVRPDISLQDRYKARFTLTIYGINLDSRPESRLMELKAYEDSVNKNLLDYSFRYYISRN